MVTEPKLVFLAGQYFALSGHGTRPGQDQRAATREIDADLAKVRDELYVELRPMLRRHGYDQETCEKLDLLAGVDHQGHFAVCVSWRRNPEFALTGDVIPVSVQAVPTPPWHASYVLYRRHSPSSEIPMIVTDPVAILLLNIHDALHSARADVLRLHGRGNASAQWRALEQGVSRMERRLAAAVAQWSPLVPPTIDSLLGTHPSSINDFADALRDPDAPRIASYQIIVNTLEDALAEARAQRVTPKARLAATAKALQDQIKRILAALQSAARKLDSDESPDLAPMRWKPVASV